MITFTDPTVSEHYNALPDGLKSAIAKSGWESSLQEISTFNRLHIDQADIVGTETMLVMIGLADPNKFASMIQSEAGLSPELAEKITGEVDEKIFKHIRTELISLYRSRGDLPKEEEKEETIESREELLAEIEKPSDKVTLELPRIPGGARIAKPSEEGAQTWIPGQDADSKAASAEKAGEPEISAPPEEPAIPPPPAPPGPSPIYMRKLEENVTSAASVQKPAAGTAAEPKEKPQGYSTDPYREPPTA